METFSYTAVGADGKEKKGSIVAETREDAARSLKDLNILQDTAQTMPILRR